MPVECLTLGQANAEKLGGTIPKAEKEPCHQGKSLPNR